MLRHSLIWLLFTVFHISGSGAIDYILERELEAELRDLGLDDLYVNEWAAFIAGGTDVATEVARDLGYENLGQVGLRI